MHTIKGESVSDLFLLKTMSKDLGEKKHCPPESYLLARLIFAVNSLLHRMKSF